VSAYDIGYADGFFRVKAEGDYILPNGSRVVGRVSMDSICVESADESVCVFDDAAKLAKRYNTISYEILTRLNPSIKRVVV
jgi:alanine racemase